MANPTVNDPKLAPNTSNPNSTGNTEIVIGMARASTGGGDCDYAYTSIASWQPGQTTSPPLMVPFTGSWQIELPLNVDSSGHWGAGLALNSQIYAITGNRYSTMPNAPDASKVTGNQSTNTFSWSYPFNAADAPASTTALVYNALPESLSEGGDPNVNSGYIQVRSAFFFQFQIPIVGDPPTSTPFAICSDDWPGEEPSVNCFKIKNLRSAECVVVPAPRAPSRWRTRKRFGPRCQGCSTSPPG